MTKRDRKRIAQLEAALRHIAQQTKGFDEHSLTGCVHKCAMDILTGRGTMLAVRVVNREVVTGLDYGTVYSSCPTQFFLGNSAVDWCVRLDTATTWPKGNPRYEVVEIDGSVPVDVVTGKPT